MSTVHTTTIHYGLYKLTEMNIKKPNTDRPCNFRTLLSRSTLFADLCNSNKNQLSRIRIVHLLHSDVRCQNIYVIIDVATIMWRKQCLSLDSVIMNKQFYITISDMKLRLNEMENTRVKLVFVATHCSLHVC